MTWTIYRVVLQLRSPMHIGCGRVGNMLRTRSYIPGRAVWGAVTQRLTRDQAPAGKPAVDSMEYREVGNRVHESLIISYFYPATQQSSGTFTVAWPWDADFGSRFLGSYATTALSYPEQAAEEGSLHEVEFLSPRMTNTGDPLFLLGYIVDNGMLEGWKNTLNRIQFGGERCYGWGRVEVAALDKQDQDQSLFGGNARIVGYDDGRPQIKISASENEFGTLLAHTLADDRLKAMGTVEPLVGREWRSDHGANSHVGQHVAFSGVCFQPGSLITETTLFDITDFGIWKKSVVS